MFKHTKNPRIYLNIVNRRAQELLYSCNVPGNCWQGMRVLSVAKQRCNDACAEKSVSTGEAAIIMCTICNTSKKSVASLFINSYNIT